MSATEQFKELNSNSDNSYFELELNSGVISWISLGLKEKINVDIINSSVYGVVEESFRAKLSKTISEFEPEKIPKKTLWPVICNGKISWWVVNVCIVGDYSLICSTEVIFVTNYNDISFRFASLNAHNLYNSSLALSEISSVKFEVENFKKTFNEEILSTKNDILTAIEASEKAESAAKESTKSTEELKKQMVDQFKIHTDEITKLMTSSTIHDSRMNIFENHVQKTTAEALARIINQADESGKGLTKRVTLPVGFIGVLAALLQWIIAHYFHY